MKTNGQKIEQISYFTEGRYFCYAPKKRGEVESLCVVAATRMEHGKFIIDAKRLFHKNWNSHLTVQVNHRVNGKILPDKNFTLLLLHTEQWETVSQYLLGLPVSAVDAAKELELCIMYTKRIREIFQSVDKTYPYGLFSKDLLPLSEFMNVYTDVTPILVEMASLVKKTEFDPERALKAAFKKFLGFQKANAEVFRQLIENMVTIKRQERLKARLIKQANKKARAVKKPETVHVSEQG